MLGSGLLLHFWLWRSIFWAVAAFVFGVIEAPTRFAAGSTCAWSCSAARC
jgi:hypothetical protein